MAEQLSQEEREEARRLFQTVDEGSRVCHFCGGIHMRACARVAEFELYENGKLKRVKFWARGEWDDTDVIWPEMAFDDGGEEQHERR